MSESNTNTSTGAPSPTTLTEENVAIEPKFRKDDIIPDGFVFQTLICLLIVIGAALFLRKFFKRSLLPLLVQFGKASPTAPNVKRIRLSQRTNLFLIDIEGKKVVVTESTNQVTVTALESDPEKKSQEAVPLNTEM